MHLEDEGADDGFLGLATGDRLKVIELSDVLGFARTSRGRPLRESPSSPCPEASCRPHPAAHRETPCDPTKDRADAPPAESRTTQVPPPCRATAQPPQPTSHAPQAPEAPAPRAPPEHPTVQESSSVLVCDQKPSVREIFSCGRARPQERSERHGRIAFGGQLVPTHRPHAIAYLAAEQRGRKPTTRKKIRTLVEDFVVEVFDYWVG